MSITITLFVSAAALMVMAGVYNHLLLLPVPHSLCPQLVMVPCLWSDPNLHS